MESKEIKQILKNELRKVKTFIIGSEGKFFGVPEVSLTDYNIRNGELEMALISIKFETGTDPDLYSFVKVMNELNTKINFLMDKIAFDKEGKMTRPSNDMVIFSGGILVSDIIYSFRTDDILTMEIDCMFNRPF